MVAAGAAHSAQVCRWTTAEGTAAFGPTLPPGTRGQCDVKSAPAPASNAADSPHVQRARAAAATRRSDNLFADIEARMDEMDAESAAAAATRRAWERATDPRDQSIESLILRARAHRAAAR